MLCALLPIETAQLLAEIIGIVAVVALVRGTKRNGAPDLVPFRFIAAGASLFLSANIVRVVHGEIAGVDAPFPSPADVLYYVGYLLLLAGFWGLVRRRSAAVEGDNVLDAILVATCIGAITVAFVVVPYIGRSDVGSLARAMTLMYALFDLMLVSGVVRLAVGSGRRTASYYMLGGAIASALVTDVLLTFATNGVATDRIVAVASPAGFALLGLAGLHPSIAHLTDRPELRDIQLTPRRLGLLFASVVGLVVLLLISIALADVAQVAVVGTGAVAAILIVLGRLSMLVHSNERKAKREAMLRDAAGAFAQATNVQSMHQTAAFVLAELFDASTTWVVEWSDGELRPLSTAGAAVHAVRRGDAIARAQALLLADNIDCAVDDRPPSGGLRTVLATPVMTRRTRPLALVVATEAPVARQMLHVVDTLANHLAGAIDGMLLAEEVYRREQEQRFRALIEHSSDLVTVLDEDGLVVFASPACTPLLGITEAQMIGRHPFDRVHPDDRFNAASLLDRSWAVAGVLEPIEARFRHESGEWRWFEVLVENLMEQAEVGAVIIHTRDVTDRRRAQEELSAREARFRSLVQHAADLIAIVSDDLRLTYVSPAARSMLGFEPDSLVGRSITELVPADQLFVDNQMLPSLSEAQMRDASGQWRSVELTITDLRSDPAVEGIVVNARDVSERKTLESKLRHLAMHDPLTGLANRNLLHDRLAAALSAPDHKVAVLYIDIDDFKALNDSLGHGYGDSALCEISRRLVSGIRDNDLAARLGGDEFAVLLEGVGADSPMDVAERLLESLRAPIRLGVHRVTLTVSLGAAVREHDSTVESLTRNADIAMYMAKSDGKDRRQLFVPAMLESFNERIELKRDLQQVVSRDELRLVYQPVYEVDGGRMTSVEALLRWEHPTRGLVSPLKFIPLAEESGIILDIGAWVLDQACAQLAAWRAAGGPLDLKMGVNLSVAQLEHDGLVAQVEHTLARHGLTPSALVLEVTESVLAANVDLVQLQLRALSTLGVRLALDDFGTGYSSLGYLQHFELDTLKIDRSFLSDTADPAQQEGLLRAIIELARGRGMSTTAEGVEREDQLAMLTRLGCTSVQGYLFAKPLPAHEVLDAMDRAASYVPGVVIPFPAVG